MKTIHLHGSLRALAPDGLQVAADTPAECISFLSALPGFQPEAGVRKVVRIRGFESRDALFSPTSEEHIHIEPYVGGAGGSNGASILQIIVGVVMIVVGVVASPISGGSSLTLTQAGLVMMSGAMMILGGVLQLLAPSPKASATSDRSNQYLPSDQNTVKIGTRIALLIGRVKHPGHFLSFNVTSQEWSDTAYTLPGFCNSTGEGQANHCMVS